VGELPPALQNRIRLVHDSLQGAFDVALIAAEPRGDIEAWSRRLAERDGPIVTLHVVDGDAARSAASLPLERLMLERTLSVNTAAAGGNASLMAIG
jgi:RHH-type proline utilization regulon transcriptional repressor/proline dehydrogenase/delta 1-pyrroline-5-carboxylate dehydrogenase